MVYTSPMSNMTFVCIDDQGFTTLTFRSNIELLGIYIQECISPGSNVKLLLNYEQKHIICYLVFIMSGLSFILYRYSTCVNVQILS